MASLFERQELELSESFDRSHFPGAYRRTQTLSTAVDKATPALHDDDVEHFHYRVDFGKLDAINRARHVCSCCRNAKTMTICASHWLPRPERVHKQLRGPRKTFSFVRTRVLLPTLRAHRVGTDKQAAAFDLLRTFSLKSKFPKKALISFFFSLQVPGRPSVAELKAMASRQQQQIDSQHQLLAAKEQRLRFLERLESFCLDIRKSCYYIF